MTRNALRLRSAGPQAESAFGDVGSADRQRLVSYLWPNDKTLLISGYGMFLRGRIPR